MNTVETTLQKLKFEAGEPMGDQAQMLGLSDQQVNDIVIGTGLLKDCIPVPEDLTKSFTLHSGSDKPLEVINKPGEHRKELGVSRGHKEIKSIREAANTVTSDQPQTQKPKKQGPGIGKRLFGGPVKLVRAILRTAQKIFLPGTVQRNGAWAFFKALAAEVGVGAVGAFLAVFVATPALPWIATVGTGLFVWGLLNSLIAIHKKARQVAAQA